MGGRPVIASLVGRQAAIAPGEPAKATPTVNSQQIIDRYTHDIWPAMSAYNADQAQAEGPASR